jgi:hypothetical protein
MPFRRRTEIHWPVFSKLGGITSLELFSSLENWGKSYRWNFFRRWKIGENLSAINIQRNQGDERYNNFF